MRQSEHTVGISRVAEKVKEKNKVEPTVHM